jgi:plastocyanin domain-containing protein
MNSGVLLCLIGVLGLVGCASESKSPRPADGAIAIAVTEKGFEPAVVRVPAGKLVTLVVTRKTERTCAKQIVIAEENVKKDLPLGEPVEISFTPTRTGEIRYACGMDMLSGRVIVE